ncbi:MAG: fumarylacetoacetate hydrolase family protein [Ferruginibacter sp.]|nr:fumarylacetoacetate hydrolase family protein [Cytophagales bacterium]
MKIYKTNQRILIEEDNRVFVSSHTDWDAFVNRDDLYDSLVRETDQLQPVGGSDWLDSQPILAPIGSQEVWAAGVTYLRSKTARMEESQESGAATFYDKVYEAERPELFFKATAARTVGTNDFVRIRRDSTWDVPEPELALCLTASGKIVGYTIGNDMSSRSIEGENPLYLPQAKTFDRCAGLGPGIYVTPHPIPPETRIAMQIFRAGGVVFEGETRISQMKRQHPELVEFLFRECTFPQGVILMTGTCIVPNPDFTLRSGDEIRITIDHIGTLLNTVQ